MKTVLLIALLAWTISDTTPARHRAHSHYQYSHGDSDGFQGQEMEAPRQESQQRIRSKHQEVKSETSSLNQRRQALAESSDTDGMAAPEFLNLRVNEPVMQIIKGPNGESIRRRVVKKIVPIVRNIIQTDHHGTYNLETETGDGIRRVEQGVLKEVGPSRRKVAVSSGTVSWTSPEGQRFQLSYTADEHGFHPVGEHLPTPPPTPEAILKMLATLPKLKDLEDDPPASDEDSSSISIEDSLEDDRNVRGSAITSELHRRENSNAPPQSNRVHQASRFEASTFPTPSSRVSSFSLSNNKYNTHYNNNNNHNYGNYYSHSYEVQRPYPTDSSEESSPSSSSLESVQYPDYNNIYNNNKPQKPTKPSMPFSSTPSIAHEAEISFPITSAPQVFTTRPPVFRPTVPPPPPPPQLFTTTTSTTSTTTTTPSPVIIPTESQESVFSTFLPPAISTRPTHTVIDSPDFLVPILVGPPAIPLRTMVKTPGVSVSTDGGAHTSVQFQPQHMGRKQHARKHHHNFD